MSQSDYSIGSGKSGLQYRGEDNSGKEAIVSNHAGVAEPSYKIANMIWADTASSPIIIKYYDGTDWIPIGEINASTNTFTPYIGANLAPAYPAFVASKQGRLFYQNDTDDGFTPIDDSSANVGDAVLFQGVDTPPIVLQMLVMLFYSKALILLRLMVRQVMV